MRFDYSVRTWTRCLGAVCDSANTWVIHDSPPSAARAARVVRTYRVQHKCGVSEFDTHHARDESTADRLALADAHDETGRICAIVLLACAFGVYHAAKVPWAAALPPDAGRDARPAASTLTEIQALVGVGAERFPSGPRVRAAPADGRGRARERARARPARVDVACVSSASRVPCLVSFLFRCGVRNTQTHHACAGKPCTVSNSSREVIAAHAVAHFLLEATQLQTTFHT